MKTKTIRLFRFTLLIYLFTGTLSGFSQLNKIIILNSSADKQLSFACDEIKKAAVDNGYVVTLSKTINARSNDKIVIKIISDSV